MTSWTSIYAVVAIGLLKLCCTVHCASSRVIYQTEIGTEGCRIAIQLREAEDVCALLKKYIARISEKEVCKNVSLSYVQNELTLDLLTQPAKLSQVVLQPNLFIDCTLPNSPVCEKQSYRNCWKNDRVRFLDSLVGLIRDNIETEAAALQNFIHAYEDGKLKLTSLESVQLFASAYTVLPNCSFILNRFGQSLEVVGNSNLRNSLYEIGVTNRVWPSKMQRPEMDYTKGLTSRPWHDRNGFPVCSNA